MVGFVLGLGDFFCSRIVFMRKTKEWAERIVEAKRKTQLENEMLGRLRAWCFVRMRKQYFSPTGSVLESALEFGCRNDSAHEIKGMCIYIACVPLASSLVRP